jgi:ribosomal protein S27E
MTEYSHSEEKVSCTSTAALEGDWAAERIARLEDEVSRRDAILDWLRANAPRVLELCPYKMGEHTAGRECPTCGGVLVRTTGGRLICGGYCPN